MHQGQDFLHQGAAGRLALGEGLATNSHGEGIARGRNPALDVFDPPRAVRDIALGVADLPADGNPPRSTAVVGDGAEPPGQRDGHIRAVANDGRLKWQAPAGPLLSGSADRGRHRLCHSQPYDGMCTPGVRPLPGEQRIAGAINERSVPDADLVHQRRCGSYLEVRYVAQLNPCKLCVAALCLIQVIRYS